MAREARKVRCGDTMDGAADGKQMAKRVRCHLGRHIKLADSEKMANICGMAKQTVAIFPAVAKQLQDLGLRLRMARERRKIGQELFAERMGVSRETLRRLEKGDASIAMGTFMRALRVLGLDKDVDLLAADDDLGRKLQDLELPVNRNPHS